MNDIMTGIQSEFRPGLEEALRLCVDRFGSRLRAVYLGGSVAFGEAAPGVSDVDGFMFLDGEPTDEDRSWRRESEAALGERHPAAGVFHLNLHSLDTLRRESFWRYILRYNAVRLHGTDVISQMEKEGVVVPAPSRELSRSRVAWLEKALDAALEGRVGEVLFPLPENPRHATRKLARWFFLVEGAHLLMAEGQFTSFRQRQVLADLKRLYPQWSELVLLAERAMEPPFGADVPPREFIVRIEPFVRWMIARIRGS